MKVLILGGAGMLGHKIFQSLPARFPDTWCTVQGTAAETAALAPGLLERQVIVGVDATNWPDVEAVLAERKPHVVVNCVGVIKHREQAKDAIPSIAINSLLPHLLARWCERWGARLIHFSTDCVFSGERGHYTEEDASDARDLYGKTKFLGEVGGDALTLRTSIIGRELQHFESLLEWFLGRDRGPVKGFTRAFYSGVTTNYLAGLVGKIIEEQPELRGLYQVAGPTIPKFDLLCLLRNAYSKDIEVIPDDSFFCDRSMQGDKFVAATGYHCPPWVELVAQLARDDTPYEKWRQHVQQAI
jgi:dTDP-4-dehydrorhamnose reductase